MMKKNLLNDFYNICWNRLIGIYCQTCQWLLLVCRSRQRHLVWHKGEKSDFIIKSRHSLPHLLVLWAPFDRSQVTGVRVTIAYRCQGHRSIAYRCLAKVYSSLKGRITLSAYSAIFSHVTHRKCKLFRVDPIKATEGSHYDLLSFSWNICMYNN